MQHNTHFIAGPPPEDGAIDALLEQARSAVDPFAAVLLYEKALEARPDDTVMMGDAAELMLQLGQTEQAKQVRVGTSTDRRDMCRKGLERISRARCQRHVSCFIHHTTCLRGEKPARMFSVATL